MLKFLSMVGIVEAAIQSAKDYMDADTRAEELKVVGEFLVKSGDRIREVSDKWEEMESILGKEEPGHATSPEPPGRQEEDKGPGGAFADALREAASAAPAAAPAESETAAEPANEEEEEEETKAPPASVPRAENAFTKGVLG